LVEGRVYTVESVQGSSVFLVEARNRANSGGWFLSSRFEAVPEVARKFKAGDKVRNVKDSVWTDGPQVGKIYTVKRVYGIEDRYLVLEEFAVRHPDHNRWSADYELVTEPEQEFIVTRVYPNGGYGVTHYFATEQEAREHISTNGYPSVSYKLSRVSDSQLLKVREETTVTRTVEAV
jgi:hypothetical protein